MPSAKKLVKQEERASYNYFKDLCREGNYDEATLVIFAHPEIMKHMAKEEMRVILNDYRESYMKAILAGPVSRLEKAARNVEEVVKNTDDHFKGQIGEIGFEFKSGA